MNNSISNNASSISSLSNSISSNSSSISNLSNSITSLGNRVTTLETTSSNPVVSISTGDIIDVKLVDNWGNNIIHYQYMEKSGDKGSDSIHANTSTIFTFQFEIFINLAYNTIFLFSLDPYMSTSKLYRADSIDDYRLFKWSATFNINGKSYTEQAYIPSRDQLYKYMKHPFGSCTRKEPYYYINGSYTGTIKDTSTTSYSWGGGNFYPCIECAL